jgi:hypothetical protein
MWLSKKRLGLTRRYDATPTQDSALHTGGVSPARPRQVQGILGISPSRSKATMYLPVES